VQAIHFSGMSFWQKTWRATIGRFIDRLNATTVKELLRDSFDGPLVSFRRENMIYYENGRSVGINSDFGSRKSGLDFVIYQSTPLRWQDTGELLTPKEADEVYSKLPDLLARRNIRWAYSEMVHKY
jgi:hypothetical protein